MKLTTVHWAAVPDNQCRPKRVEKREAWMTTSGFFYDKARCGLPYSRATTCLSAVTCGRCKRIHAQDQAKNQ